MPKTALPTHKNIYLNIIADTTCFGRELGILVLMECITKTVVYHQIVKAEKDVLSPTLIDFKTPSDI